jgi:hypothetical protein
MTVLLTRSTSTPGSHISISKSGFDQNPQKADQPSLSMAKFPSLITTMAAFALLACTSSCTTITTPAPQATGPAINSCSTTRLSSRYVHQPEVTCITCSCGTPKTRIPCTTPTPVTNTVTTSLPYISDCTLYYGCETRCNCNATYCTWETKATTSTA